MCYIDIDTTNIQIYPHYNHCFVSPGLTQRDHIKKNEMKWMKTFLMLPFNEIRPNLTVPRHLTVMANIFHTHGYFPWMIHSEQSVKY